MRSQVLNLLLECFSIRWAHVCAERNTILCLVCVCVCREEHDLHPLSSLNGGPYIVNNSKVPHSYLYSPSLLNKPRDWGQHIDVCGFSVPSVFARVWG